MELKMTPSQDMLERMDKAIIHRAETAMKIAIFTARDHLVNMVDRELSSTKQEYLQHLSPVNPTSGGFEFHLEQERSADGFDRPRAIEGGMASWNMRELASGGHLRSPKSKVSKKGNRYIDVPIKGVGIRRMSEGINNARKQWQNELPARNFFGRARDIMRQKFQETMGNIT